MCPGVEWLPQLKAEVALLLAWLLYPGTRGWESGGRVGEWEI